MPMSVKPFVLVQMSDLHWLETGLADAPERQGR